MKLDLHVHSFYSADCFTKPKDLVKKAYINEMGFAITDHDSTKGWKKFKQLSREYKVPVIFGKEIKVNYNSHFAGELLLLFMQEDIKSNDLFEIIDFAKENDVLLVVPHPFDLLRMRFKYLKILKKLKRNVAIEIFNARCWSNTFNEIAEKFALKHNLPFSAGSDAHLIEELGSAYIVTEAHNKEEIKKSIKKRNISIVGKKNSNIVHFKSFIEKLKHLVP